MVNNAVYLEKQEVHGPHHFAWETSSGHKVI